MSPKDKNKPSRITIKTLADPTENPRTTKVKDNKGLIPSINPNPRTSPQIEMDLQVQKQIEMESQLSRILSPIEIQPSASMVLSRNGARGIQTMVERGLH